VLVVSYTEQIQDTETRKLEEKHLDFARSPPVPKLR
jgi:hypothetical protein